MVLGIFSLCLCLVPNDGKNCDGSMVELTLI